MRLTKCFASAVFRAPCRGLPVETSTPGRTNRPQLFVSLAGVKLWNAQRNYPFSPSIYLIFTVPGARYGSCPVACEPIRIPPQHRGKPPLAWAMGPHPHPPGHPKVLVYRRGYCEKRDCRQSPGRRSGGRGRGGLRDSACEGRKVNLFGPR